MPMSLQKQLKIKSEVLVQMARDWMPVAAELKLWTFYETIDTDLTDGNVRETDRVSFQAPITSIKSAILELHHEVDRPVVANHADCAAFGPDNEYTKRSFIRMLCAATNQAQKLSLLPHKNNILENLDKKIDVEVHGFYESTDQKADKNHKKTMRLWSTINSFDIFMKDGPSKCLQDRLQEKTVPPTRTQMIAASSRRTSFRLDSNTKPGPSGEVGTNQKTKGEQKPMAERPSVPRLRSLLTRNKEPAAAPPEFDGSHGTPRRFSLPALSPTSEAQAPSAAVPSILGSSGNQNRGPAPAMPSVRISEHDDEMDLRLTPSVSYPSESTAPSDLLATEMRPQLRSYPSPEVPDTGGITSRNPSTQRPERLSPRVVQSRPNLNAVSPPLADDHHSDDSGTESNYSNGGGPPTAGPPRRPDPESQKLVWIHLAYNNPKWVSVSDRPSYGILANLNDQDVFSAISKERKNSLSDTLLADIIWCKRHIRGRNTHYHACFVKPGCILIHPQLSQCLLALIIDIQLTVLIADPPTLLSEPPRDIMMSLYIPYLHWDTYRRMVKRRHIVKERLTKGRSRPTPENIGTMDLELVVAWKYLGYDPPFHTRRTLDQFGYPNLSDTRARDDDQMLYKMTKHPPQEKEERPTQDGKPGNAATHSTHEKGDEVNLNLNKDFYKTLKDGKVLMVDQVWLWIVDNGENSRGCSPVISWIANL